MIVNANAERVARVATNGGVRSGTFRLRRPLGSRLDAWLLVGRAAMEPHLVRRLTGKLRVRSILIEPSQPSLQLLAEPVDVERHDDSTRAFICHRKNGSLHGRDRTVAARRAEALPNIVPRVLAPVDERAAGELWALVGDQMLGFHAGCFDQIGEPLPDLFGGGLLREDADARHASRKGIDDDRYPPREWPRLFQGERMPRSGQAVGGRHHGEVEMPNVPRMLGDDLRFLLRLSIFVRRRRLRRAIVRASR